ncbi:MAG: dienelactone hydrolase family protein [Gammaproteobacteria bacterium]|nr:dienelactone hydrolase family protein [Gammaproteobacteria bacterium]MDH3749496.1 dienelactone hydrolase family protein [Gammaproteobacteria bacterium]MDH3804655.1 dienelactone hydrolase family protein [Gammaproteobacteria bacterium]
MLKNIYLRRGLTSGLLGLALLVAACEFGGSGSSEPDKEAGRANVDAMSREHAGDTPDPSEGAQVAPQRAIVSERLPYAEVNDELVYGHFVFPSDMIEPLPAIIVIHEWWGLNDNVRAMADRLAGEGYIVLAIDLFGGSVAANAAEARQQMLAVVENPEPAAENIRKAYDFVKTTAGAPRIGSLGWCFGGGWSLNTAMLFPDELDATVIYYGQVTDDEDRLRDINAPILGLFGAEDRGITVESVRNFEAALERLRKNYEIHVYPGADHAFANPSGNAYNAEVAEDAWMRTLEFLDRHLSIEVGEDS